ncbi:hypothetical protein DLE01_02025, partial [Streptomyces sp. FT05W]
RTTSGRTRRATSTASAPLLASPTTSMPSAPRIIRNPVRTKVWATHLARQLDGPILWAPAVKGGVPLSTRGGDVELCLGQDLSIGYLDHDATSTRLHFYQAFTFRMPTPEAVVSLIA